MDIFCLLVTRCAQHISHSTLACSIWDAVLNVLDFEIVCELYINISKSKPQVVIHWVYHCYSMFFLVIQSI